MFSKKISGLLAFLLILTFSASTLSWAKGRKPPKAQDQDAVEGQPADDQDADFDQKVKNSKSSEDVVESSEQTPAADSEPAHSAVQANSSPRNGTYVTVWVWQETKDCLWRLAKTHYHDPWKWKKIYLANRNLILNPNVIFPKQRIFIPSLEQ